ncbi:probable serine/threonine-protein kinase PBL19 [Ipomoea triloba]|uniref:probable serine/threonine-protein kinase PBL19 n=1 Tax=Ipomoea triloba TaxID=35885 RepID=UPI00125D85DE|nr:probable serine/threonine-protein kinase PBL19 [Ipomoea triloba]
MMKCFHVFKDKSRSKRRGESAPELGNRGNNNSSATTTTSSSRATKSTGSASSPRGIPEMYREKSQNLRAFSLSHLREATNNFHRTLKLGEGGFGSVYKGSLMPPDGQGDPLVVAIKKLNTQGLQGHKQWVAEVQFLAVLEHPNLVKLLGYCATDGERGIQRLLVYEYMPNKSLEDHLFRRAMPALPWRTRLNIILGAAQGMAYLHEGLEVQVIYRDFKSSNVLLDENFNPKLSDFGLAREGPIGDRTHVSTAPVGTVGYAAPEYVETGHLTIKSDIWSFGVVLYEILTGRRTIERNRPTSEQKLLDWVKQFPADSNKFRMIIDPRLQGRYSLNAARQVAKLADSCLTKNARNRPSMSQVVEALCQIMQRSEEGTSEIRGPEPVRTSRAVASDKQFGKKPISGTSRQMTSVS